MLDSCRVLTLKNIPVSDTTNLLDDLFNAQAHVIADQDDPPIPTWEHNDNDFLAATGMDPWSWAEVDVWNALAPTDGEPPL